MDSPTSNPQHREEWLDPLLARIADPHYQLPPQMQSMHPQIRQLLESDDVCVRVTAGQWLANRVASQAGEVVSAAQLLYGLLVILLAASSKGLLWPITFNGVLMAFAGYSVDAGMGKLLHTNAPAWLPILEESGNADLIANVRLQYAEALINDGLYEQARDILSRVQPDRLPEGLPAIHTRLSHKLNTLLKRPDERILPADPDRVLRETLSYLKTNAPSLQLTSVLEQHGYDFNYGSLGLPAFPPVPHHLAELEQLTETLLASRTPKHTLGSAAQGALSNFQAPGNGPADYRALARIADRIGDAAVVLGFWEEAVTNWYLSAVAWRRAGDHAPALNQLLRLAAEIDTRRRLVHDPLLRAGVAMYLPHLWWLLADSAIQIGHSQAALFGMEMGKARILADLRLNGKASPATPAELYNGLRHCLGTHPRTHLLSYLVDTTADGSQVSAVGVRALLLSAAGSVHTAGLPLTDAAINAVAGRIEKLISRGGEPEHDFTGIFHGDPWRRPFEPSLEILIPLCAWMEPLLQQGVLQQGDTLVVAADGSLHNLPFGMLPFMGAPLIESFAVVSMPSLVLAIDETPVATPRSVLAALGPMKAEKEAGRTFRDEMDVLEGILPATILENIEDLREALSTCPADLIHLACHGTFVRDAPLRKGGLVMPNRQGDYNQDDETFLLTPEQLRVSGLLGRHLTIRACLVGRVRQITSREALGVVWALLSAGTATLTAASWSVESESAALWCNFFYQAWLQDGQTRAHAHRTACLRLRRQSHALAHPCHWAPLVLYAGSLQGGIV